MTKNYDYVHLFDEAGESLIAWLEKNECELKGMSKRDVVKRYREDGGRIQTDKGTILALGILDRQLSKSKYLTEEDKEKLSSIIKDKLRGDSLKERTENKKKRKAEKQKRKKWCDLSNEEKEKIKAENRAKREKAQAEVDKRERKKLLNRETTEQREKRIRREQEKEYRRVERLKARAEKEKQLRIDEIERERKARQDELDAKRNKKITEVVRGILQGVDLKRKPLEDKLRGLAEEEVEIQDKTAPLSTSRILEGIVDKDTLDKVKQTERQERSKYVNATEDSRKYMKLLSEDRDEYGDSIRRLTSYVGYNDRLEGMITIYKQEDNTPKYYLGNHIIGKKFFVVRFRHYIHTASGYGHDGYWDSKIYLTDLDKSRDEDSHFNYTYDTFLKYFGECLQKFEEYIKEYYIAENGDIGTNTEEIKRIGQLLTERKEFVDNDQELFDLLDQYGIEITDWYFEVFKEHPSSKARREKEKELAEQRGKTYDKVPLTVEDRKAKARETEIKREIMVKYKLHWEEDKETIEEMYQQELENERRNREMLDKILKKKRGESDE